MIVKTSLFDANELPALETSSSLIQATFFGEVAVARCVLAVALFGFALLSGRVSIFRSWMTVAGCFMLIGAPGIAASLIGLRSFEPPQQRIILPPGSASLGERALPPPVENDPYAGAALRKD